MKGQRSRERLFQVLNWLVSIVLAGFLIGFGGLVIGDLPKVSSPVTVEQFMPAGRKAELEQVKHRVETERADLLPRLEAAGEKRDRATETYTSAREAFDNWVKTRTATGDGAQDADLVSRTRDLDRLKSLEDAARTEHAALSDADNALGEKANAADKALKKIGARTCPGCDRGLPTMEGAQLDYCVHCGLRLFNHCSACETRKFAFFRYCMSCGSPASPEGQAG